MSEKIDSLTKDEWIEIYEIMDGDGDLSPSGKVALKVLKVIKKH